MNRKERRASRDSSKRQARFESIAMTAKRCRASDRGFDRKSSCICVCMFIVSRRPRDNRVYTTGATMPFHHDSDTGLKKGRDKPLQVIFLSLSPLIFLSLLRSLLPPTHKQLIKYTQRDAFKVER